MASDKTVALSDANFEDQVLQAAIPVLVDFWAEWCPPCRQLAPIIDDLAAEFEGKVRFGKVDTDASRATALKYGISAIPTVMIFKGGQKLKQFVGLQSKKDLKAAINEALT